MVPLYFQAVRGDSPSEAGMRLIIPALATPVGGVIAGSLMHRGYPLSLNVRLGTATMLLGNLLATSMGMTGNRWREFVYLVPANLGLGLTNPSVLFSFVSLWEHRGTMAVAWMGVKGARMKTDLEQSKRLQHRLCTSSGRWVPSTASR
jgi:hypothetical protein